MGGREQTLWAISPIDGRYSHKLEPLGNYVSEAALIYYRLRVESQWLIHLGDEQVLDLSESVRTKLKVIGGDRNEQFIRSVKEIESTTNHDVKAVEYVIQRILKDAGAGSEVLSHVHFGCTSEDINNLAYGLMLKDIRDEILLTEINGLIDELSDKARTYVELPMLSRTHGQPASPTTLGKELAVFVYRLRTHAQRFSDVKLMGKMNGAVGNFNAHQISYPEKDWVTISKRFIKDKLGLTPNELTTQIENHDSLIEYTDALARFNTVLIGLCRDIWGYISLGYFQQAVNSNEVGSSTMPHKVNPIDFENAEGNLGVANALARHFSDKLLISRWQRDLSDSTVLRSLSTYFAHSLLAYRGARVGITKVSANTQVIVDDLESHWEVLAEPVQMVLRRFGVVNAYERLKDFSRGHLITKQQLHALIDQSSELPDAVKKKLKSLTPKDYTGIAKDLARNVL